MIPLYSVPQHNSVPPKFQIMLTLRVSVPLSPESFSTTYLLDLLFRHHLREQCKSAERCFCLACGTNVLAFNPSPAPLTANYCTCWPSLCGIMSDTLSCHKKHPAFTRQPLFSSKPKMFSFCCI